MSKTELTFTIDEVIGTVEFPRDVTAHTRESAYNAYNTIVQAPIKAICLNFEKTDYMNSAGIGLIISLVEDADQASRMIYAFGLGSHYRKLFSMVGLNDRLTLLASMDEVRQHVAAQG